MKAKFLIIHNRYSQQGGEEQVVQFQSQLLRKNGHKVIEYFREHGEVGKARSFFTALRNKQAICEIEAIIDREKPDAAIIHNLFPVISAAILPVLKRRGVKILMTLHNYRLICPNGLFYVRGENCERCGSSRLGKFNCALRRCEGSRLGSIAWSIRGIASQKYFHSVDHFMALSEFQIDKITQYSTLPRSRFSVVPNSIDPSEMPESTAKPSGYIGFVGRLSSEKGIELLFEVARLLPHLQFKVAGESGDNLLIKNIPSNIELVGFLNREQLADFYCGAEKIILTSRTYEGLPMIVIEAMYYNTTVVVPNWSVLPEIVDGGSVGQLYKPHDAEDLVKKITAKVDFGELPHLRVMEHYNSEKYYQNILRCI